MRWTTDKKRTLRCCGVELWQRSLHMSWSKEKRSRRKRRGTKFFLEQKSTIRLRVIARVPSIATGQGALPSGAMDDAGPSGHVSDAERPTRLEADSSGLRQCVTCHHWRETHEFITLASTGREVKSCRTCRLSSKRKNERKRLQQNHVERWVERLKHRTEVVYARAALTPEVRSVIDQALLGCIERNRAI